MSVWFAIPSARPVEEVARCVAEWQAHGYRVALLRQGVLVPEVDLQAPTEKYLGWAKSTNILAHEIILRDPDAEWIVGGGDDYLPDSNHIAEEVARECTTYFGGTFGIMQPTGDRWGEDEAWARERYPDAPAYIDRIAGSPWMGREWCQCAYGGRGPLWAEYYHMFADEELQHVAIRLGVFWQRRDLVQRHNHWMREHGAVPDFLKPVNTQDHWSKSRELFYARKSCGFPDHQPMSDLLAQLKGIK